MKVVLTLPFCWPYMRRGIERNADTLSRYLVRQGHEVTTISTKPDKGAIEMTEGGKRILSAPLSFPLMRKLRIEPHHTFFFHSYRTLRSLRPDVVHSFYFTDALAACFAKGPKNYKTILQMSGVPIPGVSCYRWLPPEGRIFKEAIRRVDERLAVSHYVRDLMREHYGVDCRVLPPVVVQVDSFPIGAGPPDGRPTILSVADFAVRKKGIRVLIKAFQLLKQSLPSALLRLSGNMPAKLQTEVFSDLPESVRTDIQVLGLGHIDDLPRLYGEASVMVLPSMSETAAAVLVESMATGTPVVATNHGGTPEFVKEGVGVLFDPKTEGEETMNAEGLTEALREGIALSEKDTIRADCRRHAEQFSPQVLGPQLERIYAD